MAESVCFLVLGHSPCSLGLFKRLLHSNMPRLSPLLGNAALCWVLSGTAEPCVPHGACESLRAASDSQWHCSPSPPHPWWLGQCGTQLPPAKDKRFWFSSQSVTFSYEALCHTDTIDCIDQIYYDNILWITAGSPKYIYTQNKFENGLFSSPA